MATRRAVASVAEGLQAQIDRAAEALAGAPQVALACHVNPDPDAIGSMLGLAHYLAAAGTEVVCSWGNQPMVRPRWLDGLDGTLPLVQPKDFPAAPPVMVALDTASPDRLGALRPNSERAGEVIVIDHHRTNPGFGSIVILDPEASSTAELVFRLVERMGGGLPDGAAPCLYAGLVADTGRFQYEATTPETLRVAAELRRHPFDHTRLAQSLFEQGSLGFLRVLATALERLAFVPEVSMVWTYVTQGDLARAGVTLSDLEDLIDVVRTAREADVACVAKQQGDGRFRISLRSRGQSDVASVSAAFGGGGHRLAAGYTAPGGLEDAIQLLAHALAAQRAAHPIPSASADA